MLQPGITNSSESTLIDETSDVEKSLFFQEITFSVYIRTRVYRSDHLVAGKEPSPDTRVTVLTSRGHSHAVT